MFLPDNLIARAHDNTRKFDWAKKTHDDAVAAAAPWLAMSDEQLWSAVFGPTITRSWMVWSDGVCPSCRQKVVMYNWVAEPFKNPWKLKCPSCAELFPKNDFKKFYNTGLDAHGVFDPKLADRSLLFNAEHPDPNHPLHKFGVDDGEGYVAMEPSPFLGRGQGEGLASGPASEGEEKKEKTLTQPLPKKGEGQEEQEWKERRWRFVGTYLIYGQWKNLVVAGITNLAAAYVLTGDTAYAHKCAVLLDRVADLYGSFDHIKQALVYETVRTEGFVSTWHDACEETREMALAYDYIKPALANDAKLAAFLAEKAKRFSPPRPKMTPADVAKNIEEGILGETLREPRKIQSNYPRREIALSTILLILGGEENQAKVRQITDEVIAKATAVDGVTGEKGLDAYSSYVLHSIAMFLGQLEQLAPGTIADLIKRHPKLARTFRFHVDTWIGQKYYPHIGDAAWFAARAEQYVGAGFPKDSGLYPSNYELFWKLYEITGDAAYVQVLYHANGMKVDGLPHSVFAADPAGFQRGVAEVIQREGAALSLTDIDFKEWNLAIFRAREGQRRDTPATAQAVWLDYDRGGNHCHGDGMNIGLYAYDLDLMADLGYPPVNFGGWDAPRSTWYRRTEAHNTVIVDQKRQEYYVRETTAGVTKLWASGKVIQAIRSSGPDVGFDHTAAPGPRQFERTLVIVPIAERDFYVLDIFRVVGGSDHAKFQHSSFAKLTTAGLNLSPSEGMTGESLMMRGWQTDAKAKPGWSADFAINDYYKSLPAGSDIHLRYTDLTNEAEASTCEGWIVTGSYDSTSEVWIPRLMIRRRATDTTPGAPLASCFVSVIEPSEGKSKIKSIRRLPLTTRDGRAFGDGDVAVEVELVDGRRDLIIAADVENPLGRSPSREKDRVLVQTDWKVELDGELAYIRQGANGKPASAALGRGVALGIGGQNVKMSGQNEFIEVNF